MIKLKSPVLISDYGILFDYWIFSLLNKLLISLTGEVSNKDWFILEILELELPSYSNF